MSSEKLLTVRYSKLRSYMQTGDAILWKGKGLLSRLIRLFGDYSHVSVIVRLQRYEGLYDRVFLVEALSQGLQLRLLSERLKRYNGEAFFYHVDLEDKQRNMIRKVALEECGKGIRYDYSSLFRNILGRVSIDARQYFCSEFLWRCWQVVGFAENKKQAPRPGDIPKWIGDKGSIFKIAALKESK